MVKSVRFVYACMTGRKEAFWVSDSRKSDDDLYVVGRLFNFDIGGDVLCLVSSALALLLCSPLLAAVAILFAAVSNQEKLVTPRLATLDTKSTLEIQHTEWLHAEGTSTAQHYFVYHRLFLLEQRNSDLKTSNLSIFIPYIEMLQDIVVTLLGCTCSLYECM